MRYGATDAAEAPAPERNPGWKCCFHLLHGQKEPEGRKPFPEVGWEGGSVAAPSFCAAVSLEGRQDSAHHTPLRVGWGWGGGSSRAALRPQGVGSS